jgi:hypothetical protein
LSLLLSILNVYQLPSEVKFNISLVSLIYDIIVYRVY